MAAQQTNNETLEQIITKVADSVNGKAGAWQFKIRDRVLVCYTDESNNRMRIISPITETIKLDDEDLYNSLLANFHTALDVKYAISDDVLWSVFIHPLAELTDTQIEEAIYQVYNAAETYGTIYSSTNLSFPGAIRREVPKKEKKLNKI